MPCVPVYSAAVAVKDILQPPRPRSFTRYDWTKVATPVSDEDKALVTEMWCSETTVEGRPVLDGKVFK